MKFYVKFFSAVALIVAVAAGTLYIFFPQYGFSQWAQSTDEKVVHSLTLPNEVILLRLGIQGITEEQSGAEILGQQIPGTTHHHLLQYSFQASLGVNGKDVNISQVSEKKYRIDVPKFVFLGQSDIQLKTIVDNDGVLSFLSTDVDPLQVATRVLNTDAKNEYITQNIDILKRQTQDYYSGIVRAIDPEIELDFTFVQ